MAIFKFANCNSLPDRVPIPSDEGWRKSIGRQACPICGFPIRLLPYPPFKLQASGRVWGFKRANFQRTYPGNCMAEMIAMAAMERKFCTLPGASWNERGCLYGVTAWFSCSGSKISGQGVDRSFFFRIFQPHWLHMWFGQEVQVL